MGTSFTQMMKLKRGETVVFAYIVYKSRAHRNQVNAKVMKEMNAIGPPKDMPFDMKRMVYGGFKTLVRVSGAASGETPRSASRQVACSRAARMSVG